MAEYRFRIWYGDGSVYEGVGREDAFNAPTLDVQVILQAAEHLPKGYSVTHTKDVYSWRDDGGWFGMDSLGMHFYLAEQGIPKYCIFGRTMVDRRTFDEVLKRALAEGLDV